jgi:hypothetical protein
VRTSSQNPAMFQDIVGKIQGREKAEGLETVTQDDEGILKTNSKSLFCTWKYRAEYS